MTDQRIDDLGDSMSEAEAAAYRSLEERCDANDRTIARIRAMLEVIVQQMEDAGLVVRSRV